MFWPSNKPSSIKALPKYSDKVVIIFARVGQHLRPLEAIVDRLATIKI
jgi:hypothetical protein